MQPLAVPPADRRGRRLAAPLLFVLGLALLGGCATLRQATGRFERPRLDYESWSAALDAEGVTIVLQYRLQNPNDFELDLRRLAYRVEVEGRRAGEGELPTALRRSQRMTPAKSCILIRFTGFAIGAAQPSYLTEISCKSAI